MAPENPNPQPWPAPTADAPIVGTVEVPGSKSLTNRALLLACLSQGPSQIDHALAARDTMLMIDGLRQLGADITVVASSDESDERGGAAAQSARTGRVRGLRVQVTPLNTSDRGERTIDCGLAGTVMRFLPACAALQRGVFHFSGDVTAQQRPMASLLKALGELGVDVGAATSLPFTVAGRGRVSGGQVDIDASASSQFISGLLLAGARFDNGLRVRNTAQSLPSQPHIDMSVGMLARHAVEVETHNAGQWRIDPGPLQSYDWAIEPDLSNAMPFFAAAALTGGTVTVPALPPNSLQPITQVRALLHRFGCTSTVDDGGLTVKGPTRISAVDVDMSGLGELVPTAAALCAFADDTSWLRGIGHIRGHETDRIAALVRIFEALGGSAHDEDGDIRIEPRPLQAGVVPTFADHRLATFGALLGLLTPGVLVEDIATTSKTMPDFPELWARLVGPGPR